MTTKIDVNEAAELLLAKDNILILCHKNPDGDTLGSAAALCCVLRLLGKTAAVACHNTIPAKYEYLNIPVYNDEFEVEYVVSVDVAGVNLLGETMAHYAHKVDLCIDHHESNNGYSNYLCLKEDYPAAAQLMYEVILAMGCEITPHVADCLYTGLITDTGCFKYSSTTPLTHVVGARLMELGAQHTMLVEKFFMSKTAKAVKLEKFMLNNLEYYFDDRCALLALTRDVILDIKPEPTDIDGLSAMPRNFEGVDVSILIRPLREEGAYKLSIRTGETVSANEIAAALGGGGHVRAAGCEVIGSLDSVKKAILKEVENILCR
ncbi:MAG: bifunctional oligoribonuclease/PAP phosphatase NrnA [Oscillospiraceae bacterium]|nr:bifunctional oligoribonuclease/PAP phosphatase NrnA [Oscillospiraceae bacterium]